LQEGVDSGLFAFHANFDDGISAVPNESSEFLALGDPVDEWPEPYALNNASNDDGCVQWIRRLEICFSTEDLTIMLPLRLLP
jgi:hypothetical protein